MDQRLKSEIFEALQYMLQHHPEFDVSELSLYMEKDKSLAQCAVNAYATVYLIK